MSDVTSEVRDGIRFDLDSAEQSLAHAPLGRNGSVRYSQGWLRASHRNLDPRLTLPYRPYHTHDDVQPLVPGNVYELDVEIWPTSIVVPPRHRIGLTVHRRDHEYPGGPAVALRPPGAPQ